MSFLYKNRYRLFAFFTLLLCLGCSIKNPKLLTQNTKIKTPLRDRYVFLFNIDGAMIEELEAHVAAGELPQIKELFFEKGARFKNAITIYPTLSSPSHQAFLSGLFPGHHGVPSLDYFNRPLKRYIDFLNPKNFLSSNQLLFNFLQVYEGKIFSDRPQFIYEAIKPYHSLSILETFNEGSTEKFAKFSLLRPALHSHWAKRYEAVDLFGMEELFRVLKTAPRNKIPRFVMTNLYSMDLLSHHVGPQTKRSRRLYRHYDRFFTELERILKSRGIFKKTTIILLADHGQHLVHRQIVKLPKLLKSLGFKISKKNPPKGQVIWGNHGTGFSNLYFKKDPEWQEAYRYEELKNFPLNKNKRINLIEAFTRHPDIELVLAKGKLFETHLHSQTGHSRILRKFENAKFYYRYQLVQGEDPLGYDKIPEIKNWMDQGLYLDDQTWLKKTANLQRPDAVVALASIFDDYRAGDLILNTVSHKQFRKKFVTGHGSLERGDRRVPLMFYGPDILPGIYDQARLIDIGPTLLALFGRRPLGPVDGVVRKEIFNKNFLQQWKNNKNKSYASARGLSLKEFKLYLKNIKKDPKSKKEELEKARLLLYLLKQYEKDFSQENQTFLPKPDTYLPDS